MKSSLTKFALSAGIMLAMALTISCSGDDGDEGGGGGGGSCSLETLDGVWDFGGLQITISGSTGVISALPPGGLDPYKVGDQLYKGLTSTGNLTWSGQTFHIVNGANKWYDVLFTMSANGQTLTIVDTEVDETLPYTRKGCGGGTSSGGGGGSSSPSGGGSTFKDSRDNKTYKTTKIGTQTWMAENLNYNAEGSKCYGEGGEKCEYDDYDNKICTPYSSAEIQANCTKYGRLYNWETANTACPSGWRLPNNEDWDVLITAVGGEETAGKYLKAKSGWNENGNGEDKFGFSALPGGGGDSGCSLVGGSCTFGSIGTAGLWWGSESNAYYADRWSMSGNYENVYKLNTDKYPLFSVRCIEDN